MKNWIRYSLLGMAIALFAGCSSSEEEPQPVEPIHPAVVSCSMSEGSEGVPAQPEAITILFDRPIVMQDQTKIHLTPAAEISFTVMNKNLKLTLGELELETRYTLTIEAGAVVDKSTQGPCAEFVLHFTTQDKPYEPPTEQTRKLVVKNPTSATAAIYDYLWEQYGQKALSAAMANVAWNIEECEWVHTHTGKWPAIATFDYIHLNYSPCNWIDYSEISVVKDWWEDGGLVAAGWHWLVPTSQGSSEMSYSAQGNQFRTANASVEGTWENEVAQRDLVEMADMLTLLKEAGITVIWRPLHEAAGNIYEYNGGQAWFWWGNDGAEAYKALWRYMFNYFEERGLNNLIWVWTTQTKDIDFYPGDAYVDIVGRDIYNTPSATAIRGQWDYIQGYFPHKIVTLSEMGNVAAFSEQWSAGATWSYFMPWYDHGNDFSADFDHDHATIAWWRDAMASPAVISRDDLPKFE